MRDSLTPSSSAPPSDTGAESLPPRRDLPTVYRPPIQGKAKILEDRVLMGPHRIQFSKGMFPKSPNKGLETDKADSAVGLFEQLVPLLNR